MALINFNGPTDQYWSLNSLWIVLNLPWIKWSALNKQCEGCMYHSQLIFIVWLTLINISVHSIVYYYYILLELLNKCSIQCPSAIYSFICFESNIHFSAYSQRTARIYWLLAGCRVNSGHGTTDLTDITNMNVPKSNKVASELGLFI